MTNKQAENRRTPEWFTINTPDGPMVCSRYVDIRVWHKLKGPGVVRGQAQRHIINPWNNCLKALVKALL